MREVLKDFFFLGGYKWKQLEKNIVVYYYPH